MRNRMLIQSYENTYHKNFEESILQDIIPS